MGLLAAGSAGPCGDMILIRKAGYHTTFVGSLSSDPWIAAFIAEILDVYNCFLIMVPAV